MSDPVVRVEGLAELRRGLKRIDTELPKELRAAFLVVGQQVAADAKQTVPRKTGRAAGSIRAGVSGNSAYVAGGRKSVPYYGWLYFGGQLPSKRSGKKARQFRERIKEGRFLYPAIRRNRRNIEEGAAAAIEAVAVRSLPKGKP